VLVCFFKTTTTTIMMTGDSATDCSRTLQLTSFMAAELWRSSVQQVERMGENRLEATDKRQEVNFNKDEIDERSATIHQPRGWASCPSSEAGLAWWEC